MKINVTTEILDLNGEPMKDIDSNLTLRPVLTKALTELPQGVQPEGKSSLEKLNLALKIQNNDVVDFSAEDITMLMDLVGKMYLPLVSGRVWHILDPTKKPGDTVELTLDKSSVEISVVDGDPTEEDLKTMSCGELIRKYGKETMDRIKKG